MEASLNKLAPDGASYYTHVYEGPDDMSAHIKTSLVGVSHTVPITDGKLNSISIPTSLLCFLSQPLLFCPHACTAPVWQQISP